MSRHQPQPDLGNASLDAREFSAEAHPVPLFSASGEVRLIVEALIGDDRFSLLILIDRVLVQVDRREWWAFCGTCWNVIVATDREPDARVACCVDCAAAHAREQRAASFIDRVAHVMSIAPTRLQPSYNKVAGGL